MRRLAIKTTVMAIAGLMTTLPVHAQSDIITATSGFIADMPKCFAALTNSNQHITVEEWRAMRNNPDAFRGQAADEIYRTNTAVGDTNCDYDHLRGVFGASPTDGARKMIVRYNGDSALLQFDNSTNDKVRIVIKNDNSIDSATISSNELPAKNLENLRLAPGEGDVVNSILVAIRGTVFQPPRGGKMPRL